MAKSATARAPIRTADIRTAPVREEVRDVPERRTRLRKGITNTSPTHIPQEMIPEGIDLQWVTDTVYGQPDVQGRQSFEINGWRPVTGQMWNNLFDGMFMPKGHPGEIKVMGSVLMERPLELTLEARAEEAAQAHGARVAAEAQLRGGDFTVSERFDTKHPTAQRINKVGRDEGHIQVPD